MLSFHSTWKRKPVQYATWVIFPVNLLNLMQVVKDHVKMKWIWQKLVKLHKSEHTWIVFIKEVSRQTIFISEFICVNPPKAGGDKARELIRLRYIYMAIYENKPMEGAIILILPDYRTHFPGTLSKFWRRIWHLWYVWKSQTIQVKVLINYLLCIKWKRKTN